MFVPGKMVGGPVLSAWRVAACIWVGLLALPMACFASPEPDFGHIKIPRVSAPPKLEDFLSMEPSPLWRGKMATVSGFTQRVPSDGQPSTQRTDVYLGYDDKNLYAIFVCFDTDRTRL